MGSMTNPRDGAAETASNPTETAPHFHETLMQRLRRWVLGAAYALRPNRIALLPRIWLLSLERLFTPKSERDMLPELPQFYSERGLVGISNDLSVPGARRQLFARVLPGLPYRVDEVVVPGRARGHRSGGHACQPSNMQRLLRQHKFTVTMDKDFAGVMEGCARPRPGKVPLTWITPRIMQAFWDAYKAGYAHSVEVWDEAGHLVGGVFGIAIGKVYFGESKFSAVSAPRRWPRRFFTGTSRRGATISATPNG